MADAIALAREAEEIREALARKEDDPRARLAEIERRLDEHWEAEHARRGRAIAEFERVLTQYELARVQADEALTAFVSKTLRAAELRRDLETARRRAGCGAPPKASVRATRDRGFREARQEARLCSGADY
jgi:hypothetical protein